MVFFHFFFKFSRCMVTFLRNHLNFQNLFVWTNTNMISVSYQKLWIPKKSLWTCAIMHSLRRKGKHSKSYWRNGVMLKGYAQCVICMKQQKKWRHVMNIEKYMILLTRNAHLTKKVLWYTSLPTRLKQVETKIKKFWRHDQTEVVIFGQNKNRLHSATVVQFPYGHLSHKSFCRNVGLCWGSWPCLPIISSGRVVVGVWTKMIDWLEGTSSKIFLSICSSKLEASQVFL